MKATAIAPANIAFTKYWGRKDEVLRLPENGSISMNLSNLTTTTTVEFSPDYVVDNTLIDGGAHYEEVNRVIKHLDRIRKLAGINQKAKVVSKNSFPSGTGLSSSASGFAALTVAGAKAAGLTLTEKELSILARQGSGSACRSIPDGFVEWLDGKTSDTSYAVSLYPPSYWNIIDVVAIVSVHKKDIPTSEGQKLASSSPFLSTRLARMPEKNRALKGVMKKKDFQALGELVEAEALELHAIMFTSTPSLIYLIPGTLLIMKLVKMWRKEGLSVYFTINTGQDIHLLCQEKDSDLLKNKLKDLDVVRDVMINNPVVGTRLTEKHLF